MKRLLLLLSFFLLVSIGNAQAVSFYIDLSGTGFTATGATVVGNKVNFPLDMTTSGISTINQSLIGGANDAILDSGDTFSEAGWVTIISANTMLGEKAIIFDSGLSNAYIKFSGLEGYIFNYSDGGTPTSGAASILDDSFQYAFTPGKGKIEFYLDHDITDFDPSTTTNGTALKIAELSLVSGLGFSPFDVGGTFPEGQLSLTAGFTDVRPNTWFLPDFGMSFEQIMALYGTPSIFATSFNLGATANLGLPTDNPEEGIDIRVTNEGSFIISAVPEPTTMLLLGIGLIGLARLNRKS